MALGVLSKKGGYDAERFLSLVRSRLDKGSYGALLTFIGTIREKAHDGSKVVKMEYEVFEESASEVIQNIAEETSKIKGIRDVVICHLFGTFEPGDEVLFVAVASERRSEGFEAMVQAINRVKREVPIWKKEYTEKGNYWVESEGG